MNKLSVIAGMLIFFASTISPTSLNSRFVVLNRTATQLTVQMQINTNSGTDDLGGATMVIGFNKAVLSYNSNPVAQTDYTFNNFSGGNYNTAKVTRPMTDKIWINIDLPSNNNNKGIIVSGVNNWTNVVTLNFNVVAQNDTVLLRWLTTSSFWGVYDGDNATLWSAGSLTNLDILPFMYIDNTSPDITDITATNSKSLVIKFSKKLNPNSANNINNYSISNNVNINQAQLQPDSISVLIKTTQQQSNVDYALTIQNIKDQIGNTISPNPKTVNYKIASRSSGGRKVKNSISYVLASSSEQYYSADKMIDGLGMSTPDSRWQSARTMPDTVIYDLGETAPIDSLRISFYKGESGRLYKYSVYTSKDLNSWNSAVENVWSDNSEWTTLEIDSTRGRYMKLILKDCNQGKKSSIWEFENFGIDTKKITEQDQNIPNTFELSQNYPNPFNPSTKIKFSLPSASNVQLTVYNTLGELIMTLAEGDYEAGSYNIEFSASGLASGIYLYRIEAGNFAETKKMIVMK